MILVFNSSIISKNINDSIIFNRFAHSAGPRVEAVGCEVDGLMQRSKGQVCRERKSDSRYAGSNRLNAPANLSSSELHQVFSALGGCSRSTPQ